MKFFDLLNKLYPFTPLQEAGDVVLARHMLMDGTRGYDERPFTNDIIQNFEQWAGIQSKDRRNRASRFLGCKTVVSFYHPAFYGEDGKHARFAGVFRNDSDNPPESLDIAEHLPDLPSALTENYNNPYYFFNFRREPGFEDLEGRVVIDWDAPHHSDWVQRFDKARHWNWEVQKILPKDDAPPFPGVENFTLSFAELQRVAKSPEWFDALSIAGIYAILYKGQLYIGKASGKNGIIQRWQNYAKSGHGDNKKLQELLQKNRDAVRDFQFSVLQALSPSLSDKQVVAKENNWKKKLGSRDSLNSN